MSQILLKTSSLLLALVAGFGILLMAKTTTNAGTCSTYEQQLGWCSPGSGAGTCWRTVYGTTLCK